MPKFYNPIVDEYVDIDDPNYGIRTITGENLKQDPEIRPEQIDHYFETLRNLTENDWNQLPEHRAQMMAIGKLRPERSMLTDSDIERFKQMEQPQQVPEAQPSQIGQGFENRPSMKPIWNARENRNRDMRNQEAIKSLFNNQQPTDLDKLKALLGRK